MSVAPSVQKRIFKRDGEACVYCRATRDDGAELVLDHVTPKSWFFVGRAKGNPDSPTNLATACAVCNSHMKRDMDLETYAMYLRRRFGTNTGPIVRRVRAALRKKLPK